MSEPTQDPYRGQGPGQPPPPSYPTPPPEARQHWGGYATVLGRPLDLAKVVLILAWVVAGLYGLAYIYNLSQGDDFADRLFGGLPTLGQGLFFSAVLHAVAVWLTRQRERL